MDYAAWLKGKFGRRPFVSEVADDDTLAVADAAGATVDDAVDSAQLPAVGGPSPKASEVVKTTRSPIAAPSQLQTVSEQSVKADPDLAEQQDPRAGPEYTDMRRRFADMSNTFLAAAGLPATASGQNPYRSERDEMRDWLLKKKASQRADINNELQADRTKAYMAATDAQRENATLRTQLEQGKAELAKTKAERDEDYRQWVKERLGGADARDERRVKLQEEEFKRKSAPKPKAAEGSNLKGAGELRKEYNSLPEVKDFKDVSTSFEKIRRAAQNPSAAGDLSLIFAYMKVLDPGSTVREGEFANAQAAAGADQRLLSAIGQVRSGQRLTDEQRRDFLAQAQKLYDSHKVSFQRARDMYRGLAAKANAAPDDVTGPGEDSVRSGPVGAGKIKVTNGTETYEIDPADLESAKRDKFRVVQ